MSHPATAFSEHAPFLNQLEPTQLIQAFMHHPPEGFTLLNPATGDTHISPTPIFSALFDLLTTLEPALKKRLANWPGFAIWSRWLRFSTAFVGTTVTEYSVFPAPQQAKQLLKEWQAPWLRKFPLFIIKDIPCSSPLLPEADNRLAQQLIAACKQAGYIIVEGQALAYVAIDFADIPTYLSRCSASRRKDLKRKLRSRQGLDIQRIATGDAIFQNPAIREEYYALYRAVYAQSEIHFDLLSKAFFDVLLLDGNNNGVVFEYRQNGELIGWNLCFEQGGKLIDKYLGLRYPQARQANLYYVSWMVNLEYAIEKGLTHYVAGWTDPEVKAQLGAQFTLTQHAVYVRNPLLRLILRSASALFETDAKWAKPSTSL